MIRMFKVWVLAWVVGLAPFGSHALAEQQAGEEVAQVELLTTQALQAMRVGRIDQVHDLFTRAAAISTDPKLLQMSEWVGQFEQQRQTFAAERRKSFEKAVEEAHRLIDQGMAGFAIDKAKDAYTLAEDKDAFVAEPWMARLLNTAREMAAEYEQNEQWIKALRIYGDLSAIEPANPEWKEKLKLVTRRVRLVAMYNPDGFREIQQAEIKARDAADEVLKPATQPVAKEDEDRNDSFRTDWRETLRDIRVEMLHPALEHAQENYWREVNYSALATGGLRGLQTLLTTPGLEVAFPDLADGDKRDQFLQQIERFSEMFAEARPVNTERELLRTMLLRLMAINEVTVKLPDNVLISEFADGAFSELDPFSSMIWPSDLQEFNKSTSGEFSGVGIQIQLDNDGNLKVVSPLEDSPAYKAGIKAGDIVTRINGKSAKGITINQAVKNITGPVGTIVTLTVRNPVGDELDHQIRREVIKVSSVKGYRQRVGGGWEYFVDPEQKIGYARLTNFTKTTTDELESALEAMNQQGARGLVLDLRYNPGGLLTAATDVADKFLSEGTIVSTRSDRNLPQQPAVEARRETSDYDLPMVVLVNQYSASASEIVSGALQDQNRATVVGERTFGKGSVQMLFPIGLRRTAALKLTTSHYYLPSGRLIHREENSTGWGVDPDIIIEMTPEQMRAAIDARQELDVLRDAEVPTTAQADADEKPRDLLSCDPQLSAAVLLLRLQLTSGAAL
jgi:carboxyl-terminal processing protease